MFIIHIFLFMTASLGSYRGARRDSGGRGGVGTCSDGTGPNLSLSPILPITIYEKRPTNTY